VRCSGDNLLTAVSVSRQCGLVPADDQLVFANAHPPEDGQPARISWELSADTGGDGSRIGVDEGNVVDVSRFSGLFLLLQQVARGLPKSVKGQKMRRNRF
jgi:magnesium-transporting ATPase (P-type)